MTAATLAEIVRAGYYARMDSGLMSGEKVDMGPLSRVIAVETGETEAVLFIRSPDDTVEILTRPFIPWLLTKTEFHFPGADSVRLSGDGLCYRTCFPTGWHSFLDAQRALPSDRREVCRYQSAVKQFLMSTGQNLFLNMAFDDPRRMQIDIETSGLNPLSPDARIFMISVTDNRGLRDILVDKEPIILRQLLDLIKTRDPDIVEGHNIYAFDLPYLIARMTANGISPALGRQGKEAVVGSPRNCAIGTASRPFTPVYLWGRHVLDTLLQVQRFDWSRGQVSSYNLKECAQTYGLASPDRVFLDRREIVDIFRADPERVKTYALQDAEETAALAALTAPTEFFQTQLVPDSYQSVAVTGNGEKINSMLVGEYLRRDHAVPLQKTSRPYPGGYTEVRATGVIRPVVKADVESLYPSVMLTCKIAPESDHLSIFLPLLAELTHRRLDAKNQRQAHSTDTTLYGYWDGLQNSYKSLINSFYGYIGGPFYFNDFEAAKAVTEAGRTIVQSISAELEAQGAEVIEIDTDGVYFKPPECIQTRTDEASFIDRIGTILPSGIRLTHDGSYQAMLSLKVKNYVLVDYNGRKIMKGSSLRSRADERFGRIFLSDSINFLLESNPNAASSLYMELLRRIESGEMPISDLAKRERVTDKLLASEMRRRAAFAIRNKDIRQGEFVSLYQRIDKSLGLVEDYADDEDREYYSEKLYKFACRLQGAVGNDVFGALFPRPRRRKDRPDPSQGALDLFYS